MFRLSYSLRLILVGLVVISSFPCDGMPAPLPKGISLPKSPAKTTPKKAPQKAPPPPPPPSKSKVITASPKTPSPTPTKLTAAPSKPSATPTKPTAAPKKSPTSKVTATSTKSTTSHPTSTNSALKSTTARTNSTATSSQPTGTSRACPVKPPSKKPGKTRSLFRRSGPADASGDITLYHGTTPDNVAGLRTGINLLNTEEYGDFNDDYGFYLTDRMKAAGQFVCHNPNKPATSASIFEYKWAGASVPSDEIYKFPGESTAWQDFVGINNNPNYNPRRGKTSQDYRDEADEILQGKVMITGPMKTEDDKDLTDNFWQYTLIEQGSVAKLTLVTVHENIPCSKFPSGTIGVTDTQGPSEDFPEAEKSEFGIC
ncbi:hypothetical protein D9757_009907 [Collybiopsis confluens]|uniref:Uncharacterized protein n=1 Tax=Collybiopsis confluens TaxID=2823264 RepID=A0A8H5GWM2_9AGAR|nr:hypothetical protein D9757_009907 [Collybiopsis confluens]